MKPDKNSLLKNKLESRTILPSGDAWSKLEAKLYKEETKIIPVQKKKNYLTVAASVFGVIAIGATMYFLLNTNNTSQQLQNTNTATIINEEINSNLINDSVHKKNNIVNIDAEPKETAATVAPIIETNKINNETIQNHTAIAPVKKENKTDSFQNFNSIPVTAQQEKQNYNAGDEADKLLHKAMEDIQNKKYRNVLTQAKGSVLLDEVETDIKNNKSLRSKIYNEVDKRYNQIKTAFVEK